jgi:hypothetical protein
MASKHIHELPDRELHEAVAEHIMGWRWVTDSTGCNSYFYQPAMVEWSLGQREPGTLGKTGAVHPAATRGLPDYTNDIRAMWAVVEQLRELGWLVNIKAMPDGRPFYLDDNYEGKLLKPYTCNLSWMDRDTLEGTRKYIHTHPWGFGDTPGQAVCRAALESIDWGWKR